MSPDDNAAYKLQITDPSLIIERVWLKDELAKDIFAEWALRGRITYPFKRIHCGGPVQILPEQSSLSTTLMVNGPKPLMLICFFTKTAAFNGDYKLLVFVSNYNYTRQNCRNPFNHPPSLNVNSALARFGSTMSPSHGAYQPIFGESDGTLDADVTYEWCSLIKAVTGTAYPTHGIIDYDTYLYNANIYAFTFGNNELSGSQFTYDTGERDNLQVDFRFKPPKDAYTMTYFIISQNEANLLPNRQFQLDYAPGCPS